MGFGEWARARDLRAIYAAELTVTRKADGQDLALHWATAGGQWDAAHNFRPVLRGLPRVVLKAQGITSQTSLPGYGDLEVAAGEGAPLDPGGSLGWDRLATEYTFERRPVVVRAGGPDLPYGQWEVVLAGVMSQPEYDNAVARIPIASPLQELMELQVPPHEYAAGSGVPEAAVGKAIPLALGRCRNVTPVLIDEANHVYQFHDPAFGPVQAVDAVRIEGAEVTGLAVDLARGTIVSPNGRPTLDLRGRVSGPLGGYRETFVRLVEDLLLAFAGVPAAGLDQAAFAAVDAARPWPAGLYLTGKEDLKRVLDNLLTGLLCHLGNDRAGRFTLAAWSPPSGEPRLTIEERDIQPDSFRSSPDATGPAWKATISARRNWTPQGSLAEGVAEAEREWLKEDYLERVAEEPAVRELHPKAKELGPHETCLAEPGHAEELARLWLELYGPERREIELETGLGAVLAAPGDLARVRRRRHGLAEGALFRVTGVEEDHAARRLKLSLWN